MGHFPTNTRSNMALMGTSGGVPSANPNYLGFAEKLTIGRLGNTTLCFIFFLAV